MADLPSRSGDSLPFATRRQPQSAVGSDSSPFHALISGVNIRSIDDGSQLNLVRDLLQRQSEQSQGSRSASEAFTGLATELDPDFRRSVARQRQRLIAILEHERQTSNLPVAIHNFLEEPNIFDEFDSNFGAYDGGELSVNEWSFTNRAASRTVIESLPSVVLRGEDLEELCSICMEEMKIGEEAKELPCIHTYHGECIRAWLNINNTCPICRYELPKHRC